MKERGPDSFGYFQSDDNTVLLIHSRLAIRGLTDSYSQPFRCSDGSILVYNGELYNSKDLEAALAITSYPSDTPVFAEYVTRNPFDNSEVDGMYAYVRYSKSSNRVFFGRDLFGEKPLYSLEFGNYFFLFSEVKYLTLVEELCDFRPSVNDDFLRRFFVYGYRQSKQFGTISPWKDVTEVAPGSIGIVNIDTGYQKDVISDSLADRYCSIESVPSLNDQEAKEIVVNAIRKRAISDVKTGISLSGGIDSNVIAAILSKSDCPPSYAFTLSSSDPRYSEFDLALRSSSALGLKHEQVCINDDGYSPVERFLELSKSRATPFLTMTSFVSWFVARAANEKSVKVMFSGLGGDEYFSGYYDYFYYRMLDKEYSKAEQIAFQDEVLPHIKNPVMKYGLAAKSRVCQLEHHYYDKKQKSYFLNRSSDLPPSLEVYLTEISRLRSRMYSDLSTEVVPVVLHEDDLNYMSCSVENRSPFMSKEILNVSLSLPDSELMRGGYQKVFLRDLLKTFGAQFMPIYGNTRKQGYNFGIYDLMSADADQFLDILMAKTRLWDYLSQPKLEEYIHSHGNSCSESILFSVFTLQSFLLGTEA